MFNIDEIPLCIFDEAALGYSFKSTFDNGPGVFQGVRLSRKLPNGRVLQPQVVDEVIKIIAHSHLIQWMSSMCTLLGFIIGHLVWRRVEGAFMVLSQGLQ